MLSQSRAIGLPKPYGESITCIRLWHAARFSISCSVALGDPTINGSADANFLAGLIKMHIDSIRTTVLASYPGAKFELLWPYDVNFPTCYYTPDVPYPQGGRLNRAVNLPSQYLAQAGSGLDRLKMEALSWGATYRNFANAQGAIAFPVTSPANWPLSATAHLIPWFNGGCPLLMEYLCAVERTVPLLCLWAMIRSVSTRCRPRRIFFTSDPTLS